MSGGIPHIRGLRVSREFTPIEASHHPWMCNYDSIQRRPPYRVSRKAPFVCIISKHLLGIFYRSSYTRIGSAFCIYCATYLLCRWPDNDPSRPCCIGIQWGISSACCWTSPALCTGWTGATWTASVKDEQQIGKKEEKKDTKLVQHLSLWLVNAISGGSFTRLLFLVTILPWIHINLW